MHYLKNFIFLLALSLLAGCSVLQGGKLWAPKSFGLSPIAPGLYVETGADEPTRLKLRDAMKRAEDAIRAAYGGVNSRPIVSACVTEGCYEAFGGRGSVAKVYGDHILLSPRGLNWHFIGHEWSHAELRSRETLSAWWYMPQWFDEGVAVAVSEAPEHSESYWQFLVATNTPRPTREELHRFKSLRQWLDAIHRYGEDKNIERKAKGEPEIHAVYAAAGHEVRTWLAKVGSAGLLQLIEQMNNGVDFEPAYQTANTAVERDAPQATLAPRPSP